MKKQKRSRWFLWSSIVVLMMMFVGLPRMALARRRTTASIQAGRVVDDTVVLTGVVEDSLVVVDGGILVLLGITAGDVVVEPGGEAYVYGLVLGNALNSGGYMEIHGIVGGYTYTDVDGITIQGPDAIVIATPPPATPTPSPTPTAVPGTPTPTPTLAPVTPTPLPTSTPAPAAGLIDLDMSLYKAVPTSADRAPYEDILRHFADAIYEMTNGAHLVRNVTIYQNGARANRVDVVWSPQEWPCAYPSGYDMMGYSVYMGDIFNFTDFTVDTRCGGYVLAHEWGHYYYGVYDEYSSGPSNPCDSGDLSCPRTDDIPVENSVMNDNWRACRDGDFNWLNFSIPKNQTRQNAQYRVYNASAWETLIRPTSQDPRQAARMAVRVRSHFIELTPFAPTRNQDASLELPDPAASTQARSALNIVWADGQASAAPLQTAGPGNSAMSGGALDMLYPSMLESLTGRSVEYPNPILVTAQVGVRAPIAKASVQAGVLHPDGTVVKIALKDDGLPPDVLADDGLYSGFITYTQSGTYHAFARFDNEAGVAVFTEDSLEHAPGPDGETDYPDPQPVGEAFFAVANTTITVNNVRADDHGNTTGDATVLNTDNVDVTGRIDYADDVDMFAVTPVVGGKLVLRLSGFAFDMHPIVQILGSDGAVDKEFEFDAEEQPYFFTSLRGRASRPFYVAVRHVDPAAAAGLYDVSIGPALPNVIESPPLSWLLLLIPIGAVVLLAGLYMWLRPRPTPPTPVSAPTRRPYVPRQQRSTCKPVEGSGIYKQAPDAAKDTAQDEEVQEDLD
jgi:hypothetical protein